MDLRSYKALSAAWPGRLQPDPYLSSQPQARHAQPIADVCQGVRELLGRYEAGDVTESHLLRGKDNGPRKRDTLSYWLYWQHHPGSETWKLLGQPYWSLVAWRSWQARLTSLSAALAYGRNGLPKLASFPKRRRDGEAGLVSEHVVPKKALKAMILAEPQHLPLWLSRNLCCVVTIAEDRCLVRDRHEAPDDPWRRYAGTGIVLVHNPLWSDEEIIPLLRHGLVDERSFPA